MTEQLERLDNQRWLLNNGLITDEAKNNIYVYGTLVNKEVRAVEVDIDVESKKVNYKIYFDSSFLKAYKKFEELKNTDSLWGLIRLKLILRKYGNLSIEAILKSFVRDYCGPNWVVSHELRDIKEYVDGPE